MNEDEKEKQRQSLLSQYLEMRLNIARKVYKQWVALGQLMSELIDIEGIKKEEGIDEEDEK